MQKFLIGMLCCLLSFSVLGQENITNPTKASQPIPKLSETKNIDTVTTETAQEAITKNIYLKNQAVSAASKNGKVILQGSVETKQQEQQAIETIKKIAGVREVESQLTIKK